MSFTSYFKPIIEGCSAANALITGGIKYEHLPEDYDIKKSWVAWSMRLSEQVNTLCGNDAYSTYNISVTVTSPDSVLTETISDHFVYYFNNVSSTYFPDIYVTSENKTITLSKTSNSYQTVLELGAIFTSN